MIAPLADYPLSRDYERLWGLAHHHRIVCIVDMDRGKPGTPRDVVSTLYSHEYAPGVVQVSSRGCTHIYAESVEEFIACCRLCNLEWLIPPFALETPAS
jgi:hypothetical protein